MFRRLMIGFILILALSWGLAAQTSSAQITGELRRWHNITLTFTGPMTSEDANPNPFTDYRLNVTFTKGTKQIIVPGYYAADGDAADTSATTGDQWRVHFTPDEIGTWTYTASFRTGDNIAIDLNTNAGDSAGYFDGDSGTFDVTETDKTDNDFRAKGWLQYIGAHYMRFAGTGEYYLKGGADSPENFLAYYEFDGTVDKGGGIGNFLHHYEPHAGDWQTGDPTWQEDKGKNIIGILNYLASQGMNSVYFITYNLDGGDGMDTWPWTSDTVRDRFDVSKLDQWEIVFSHMTANGIQLHLLTQENENDQRLGGDASLNDTRKLYYRELIARFGHHPALQWNLGEENDNTDEERISFGEYIRALDPYDHPIVVHTYYDMRESFSSGPESFYDGILGSEVFEGTSIQGGAVSYNHWAQDYRQRSADAGRPWAIYGDEQGPALHQNMDNVDILRKDALWGNLMGGGAGVEWYFGYQGDFGDIQSEDWRIAQPLWEDTNNALTFFQTYLPFWTMQPDNELVSEDDAYALATEGQIYALYSKTGTPGQVDLKTSDATFDVYWYNPRTGGALQSGSISQITGPGWQSVGEPPADSGQDWAVLVQIEGGIVIPTVTPTEATATATEGTSTSTPTETATATPTETGSQQVTSLWLVDAEHDTLLFEMTDGSVIGLNNLPTTQDNLNILANTNPAVVGSVVFTLNGVNTQTESVAPYALFGDAEGDYTSGTLAPGSYTLTATPYTGGSGAGTAGTALTVTFTIAEVAPSITPTEATPTETVTATATEETATPTLPPEDVSVEVPAEGEAIPIVTWAFTGAAWYQVIVTTSEGVSLVDQWFEAVDICTETLCTVDLSEWLPFGLDSGNYTITIRSWTAADGVTPIGTTPIIIEETRRPVDASTGRVIITIDDDPAVLWARVWISPASSFIEVPHYNRPIPAAGWYEKATEMTCNGTECVILTDAHPTNGDYVVYMQFWDGLSMSTWGGPFAFSLNFPPADVPTNLNVAFQAAQAQLTWTPDPNTTWYQVWIGKPGSFVTAYLEWLPALDLGCGTGTCTLLPTVMLESGETYTWYVKSWGPGGESTGGDVSGWVEGNSFTTP